MARLADATRRNLRALGPRSYAYPHPHEPPQNHENLARGANKIPECAEKMMHTLCKGRENTNKADEIST